MCKVTKLENYSIKLVITNRKVMVRKDQRKVYAKVEWYLKTPYPFDDMLRLASLGKNDSAWDTQICGVSTGVAICSPEDDFETEKGKKIAMAKAESNAYLSAGTTLSKRFQALTTLCGTFDKMIDSFDEKVEGVNSHNREYIRRVGEK